MGFARPGAMIAALMACITAADAQTYPAKPIRFVLPFAAGSAVDVLARVYAQNLSELWKQQVLVDNRSGAGGTVGAAIAAKAPPDGHTLFQCNIASSAIALSLYAKPGYDHQRHFAPISRIGMTANVLIVHPSMPARTIKEYIALARAHPGKLSYASSAAGTSPQLAMELLKLLTKTDILHMAQANGVPAHDVMVFDVSRQSNRVTANVSGFLDTTRISLSDTLIQRASTDGVREVMGHEIGHYVLNHTVSILVMVAVLYAVVFALANILFGWLTKGERWGVRGVSDPAGMPLLFAVITFLFTLATPVQNNLIRFHEHQADIFGLNASRAPDGFAETALLLSEYRKMEPSPFELWFFYDHPSGYQRIHMAMTWKAHEMAAGRYPMGPGGPPEGWRPDFVVMREQGAAPTPAAPAATPEATAPSPPAQEPSPAAPSN